MIRQSPWRAASTLYLYHAWQFPLGTLRAPGAGLYPTAVGVLLLLTSAVIALQTYLRRHRPVEAAAAAEDPVAGGTGRVSATIVALLAFCALLPGLGYPVVAFLFVTVVLQRLGGGQWTTAAVGGLVTAAASHYLFAGLLGVPLPRGLF